MDINSLTDQEVKILVNEIKHFADSLTINIPLIGMYELNADVKSQKIEYKFHIYRGNIKNKYSLHLRFSENNIHLVRLCINGTVHHNKLDETKVGSNHIHIYKYDSSKDEIFDYAYNLDTFPFDKNDKLSDAVNKFTKYVNIKR